MATTTRTHIDAEPSVADFHPCTGTIRVAPPAPERFTAFDEDDCYVARYWLNGQQYAAMYPRRGAYRAGLRAVATELGTILQVAASGGFGAHGEWEAITPGRRTVTPAAA